MTNYTQYYDILSQIMSQQYQLCQCNTNNPKYKLTYIVLLYQVHTSQIPNLCNLILCFHFKAIPSYQY